MSSTGPFEVIFDDFSAHFWKYLAHKLRIILVNTFAKPHIYKVLSQFREAQNVDTAESPSLKLNLMNLTPSPTVTPSIFLNGKPSNTKNPL